jgi:hypothetical protein
MPLKHPSGVFSTSPFYTTVSKIGRERDCGIDGGDGRRWEEMGGEERREETQRETKRVKYLFGAQLIFIILDVLVLLVAIVIRVTPISHLKTQICKLHSIRKRRS